MDKRGLSLEAFIAEGCIRIQDLTVSTKPKYFFFYLNIPQLNCNKAEKFQIIQFLIENVTKEN